MMIMRREGGGVSSVHASLTFADQNCSHVVMMIVMAE